MSLKTSNVLLVEGNNDKHVIFALCMYFKVPECFEVIDCGNDDGVLEELKARILYPQENEMIGIVIDADDGYEKNPNQAFARRWKKIKSILDANKYSTPEHPNLSGTLINSNEEKPKIGIWLMPNNKEPGMLEDFIKNLVSEKDINYAIKIVEQAQTDDMTSFKPTHKSKAEVHTYLALQDEPGNPMGLAITKKTLDPETEIAQTFINWIKKLYNC